MSEVFKFLEYETEALAYSRSKLEADNRTFGNPNSTVETWWEIIKHNEESKWALKIPQSETTQLPSAEQSVLKTVENLTDDKWFDLNRESRRKIIRARIDFHKDVLAFVAADNAYDRYTTTQILGMMVILADVEKLLSVGAFETALGALSQIPPTADVTQEKLDKVVALISGYLATEQGIALGA